MVLVKPLATIRPAQFLVPKSLGSLIVNTPHCVRREVRRLSLIGRPGSIRLFGRREVEFLLGVAVEVADP